MRSRRIYTWKFLIYTGRFDHEYREAAAQIVIDLIGTVLNQGRTLYVDNYYTSVLLADELIEKDFNLVGIFRTNGKYLPGDVTRKKLKRGEIVALENEDVYSLCHLQIYMIHQDTTI